MCLVPELGLAPRVLTVKESCVSITPLRTIVLKGKAAHWGIPYLMEIRDAEPSPYTWSHYFPFQGRSLLITFPSSLSDQAKELSPLGDVLVGDEGFEPPTSSL